MNRSFHGSHLTTSMSFHLNLLAHNQVLFRMSDKINICCSSPLLGPSQGTLKDPPGSSTFMLKKKREREEEEEIPAFDFLPFLVLSSLSHKVQIVFSPPATSEQVSQH